MHKTDKRNHFQKAVYRYYRRTANLNLYVQRIQPADRARIQKEITELFELLDDLNQHSTQNNNLPKQAHNSQTNRSQKQASNSEIEP